MFTNAEITRIDKIFGIKWKKTVLLKSYEHLSDCIRKLHVFLLAFTPNVFEIKLNTSNDSLI